MSLEKIKKQLDNQKHTREAGVRDLQRGLDPSRGGRLKKAIGRPAIK